MKPIRVVLVEDEPLVRASLRGTLEKSGFVVKEEAAGAEEGIEATVRERPEVCLVDIGLNGGSGIDVARAVARRAPETAVVMLSASDSNEDLIDAIRAGASGYLLKGMDPERLSHALRGIVDGEAAIPRPLMARLVKELQTYGRRRTAIGKRGRVDLSSREWEVLDLLCDGLATAEIAARLSLSPVTVRRHVSAVTRKLGAGDRAEAVAIAEGIADPPRRLDS